MTLMLNRPRQAAAKPAADRRKPARRRGGRDAQCSACIAALLLAVPSPFPAPAAQPSKGPPNALQGFSQNRDQPVHIEAATLEVRDKDKVATFSGDVRVTQGDTNMRCKSLVVFYEQEGNAGKATTRP